ncbi:phosphoesterase family-domain-containing protein [Fimicolochytrium jonesii]|uniref:phosphoesterase family-domain-containing protein n=1 Tax=Fimicolochytrium jonesii TaxID=1396493 RepID=UPI0022FF4399|nr:phosphoesterase family-domain-containing protein [Fimicolochytrium jonesii]KAI8825941.1 phosphoesterase family-domain-containing protein [Fimicolochytrium jonesii]
MKNIAIALGAVAWSVAVGVSAAPVSSLVPGKWFDRVLTVVFENTDYDAAVTNFSPLTQLAGGRLLTNYDALFHPSQPNYLALLTGDRSAWLDSNVNVNKKNLVDLLEAGGISWKTYQELYPGNCFAGATSGKYARKHNPFISMDNVRNNPTRCAKIVEAGQFQKDLDAGTLPQFMFYTPDLNNDGHDTSPETAAAFATKFLGPLLKNPTFMKNTLVVVTWDERESFFGRNQVATFLLGPVVANTGGVSGGQDNTKYTHYSLLRTWEDNWSLGNLGTNDVKAQPFLGLARSAK